MRSVSTAIGRLEYDRGRGTFRGWLFTIARNKVFSFLSAQRVRPQAAGDTSTNRLLETQPDGNDSAADWELDYQRRLAAVAMERVQQEFQQTTWRAFWQTAVEGRAAELQALLDGGTWKGNERRGPHGDAHRRTEELGPDDRPPEPRPTALRPRP